MNTRPEDEGSKPEPEEEAGENPLVLRIIFWILLLYALGFALMVIEDALYHTFI